MFKFGAGVVPAHLPDMTCDFTTQQQQDVGGGGGDGGVVAEESHRRGRPGGWVGERARTVDRWKFSSDVRSFARCDTLRGRGGVGCSRMNKPQTRRIDMLVLLKSGADTTVLCGK